MPRAPLSLKAKALQYIAQREHSRLELRRKLEQHARRTRGQVGAEQPTGPGPGSGSGAGDDPTDGADSRPDRHGLAPDVRAADGAAVARVGLTADPAAEIDALLDWLEQRDLLSAERFVDMRLQVRMARFGNRRITQELAQHGLSLDAQAAQALRSSELSRARAVWLKRFGAVAASASERARQMRFLAARGFSAEVVHRVVGDAAD